MCVVVYWQEILAPAANEVPIKSRHCCERALVSVNDVIVTVSCELLVMFSVNVNSPPGSASASSSTVFSISTTGATFSNVTVSSSVSVAVVWSSSSATAVTTLVWAAKESEDSRVVYV
ncbi:MAG TPA: hypothetical protein VI911_09545, partial [Patescibacteria group bacterium]|nr:hypothetical protein [Patescibacteria group bacterium]